MANVFNVLTEFRFDIAHAVAGSKTLQTEVGKISAAADQAHFSLQRIGMGLVAQMGLGSGGFLGAIYSAVQASEKFSQSQRQIANIFLSNNMFKGANSFEASMSNAAMAMENMKKSAREFSLPVSELVSTSKLIGASLVNHGLDDTKLTNSTNLARGFLKSAPTLGIDPGLAQGQLLNAVMGRASMGDTLIQRLFNETDAMKPYAPKAGAKAKAGGGAVAFNSLEASKRLDILTKSLMQFGSNAKILEENANSLSGQMQRLKDNLVGMFSVFRTIGDMLMVPIKKVLLQTNKYLETHGEKIVQNVRNIFGKIFDDPEKLFVNIQQMRRLQGDVKKAGTTLGIVALVHGITAALRFLGFQLKGGLVMTGLRALGSALSWLGSAFMALGGFSLIFQALSFLIGSVLAPLAVFTFFFQILSRAMAKAQIANAKWLAVNMERITGLFAKLSDAFSNLWFPVEMSMEFLSDLVAWFFSLELSGNFLLDLFDGFVGVMEILGQTMVFTMSIISGVMNTLMGAIFDLVNMNFSGFFDRMGDNFLAGYEDMMMKRIGGEMNIDDSRVSNKVTNIDKIEIRNDFKEQMEPDRIAFALTSQITKLATNPQQASGRSLNSSLVAR